MGLKILSLFDGISCGLVALKRAKIEVDEYHAFEIDQNCIRIAKRNHPEIIHHGTVVGFDFKQFRGFDLVIGGSPCQGFSFSGYQQGFNDPRSKLYYEFERAKEETEAKYFMLENTPMDWSYIMYISKRLGVTQSYYNSDMVSAQVRKRYYWKNWSVPDPYDFKISLQDILQRGDKDIRDYKVNKTPSRDKMWEGKCKNITSENKANCLTVKQDRWGNAGLIAYEDYCRYLTPIECERLQTLPDGYTEGAARDERYKMLGNCWTVNMIAWLFWYSPFGAVQHKIT